MSRLLALWLLALAAPPAAAEQVHPCQAQTPPCSLAMAQARHYLDELDRKAGYAPTTPRAAPQVVASNSRAAAAQVYPYQAENSPCSLELELTRRDLDEARRELSLARLDLEEIRYDEDEARHELSLALRDLDEARRELGEARRQAQTLSKSSASPKPRYHVPYPLSRELLSGAVNPCAGARPACPRELENIYDGLEIWGDDKDSRHYEHYLFRLKKYYRNHQP